MVRIMDVLFYIVQFFSFFFPPLRLYFYILLEYSVTYTDAC